MEEELEVFNNMLDLKFETDDLIEKADDLIEQCEIAINNKK